MRSTGCYSLAMIAAVLLGGCGGEVDNTPVSATGGTLCVADYSNCVNPVMDAVINGRTGQTTCAASGCHDVGAGSGGAFKIFPQAEPGSVEMMANFFSAKAFANLDNPAQSKLLLEPLQGVFSISGTHTGGDIFPDVEDPCYLAIRNWIAVRVEDEEAASCGFCTPPPLAECGY
ncbi:hypothetical protein [Wenzhouxiangella sp. XN24]|uniref:hypothetical protein n=1 Tax=Wenzhouxiangella sp. XN24 TaxID=2713569 RepID=UPI0013EC4CDB|nr:hypothetical protein [Wenzhouxiangella sp. XN24]NGX15683.1 hypothetical protein [Wenzhouxiangella sp. XN24]